MSILELKPLQLKDIRAKIKHVEQDIKNTYGVTIKLSFLHTKENVVTDVDLDISTQATVGAIKRAVLDYFQCPEETLITGNREKSKVRVRRFFLQALKEYTDLSLKQQGLQVGGRDHSTAIHNHNEFDNQYDTDKSFRAQWMEFKGYVDKYLSDLEKSMPVTLEEVDAKISHNDEVAKIDAEILALANQIADATSIDTKNALLDKKRELVLKKEQLINTI